MIRSKTAMGFLWALTALCLHVGPMVPVMHGQSSRKDDIVFNSRGVPLAGATVRVCAMPAAGQPCTPLALIYSDAALTQALANPTTSDGLGNYFFYAAPGKYEIEISGPGITTKQIPNVILPSDPTSPTFTGAISAFSLNLTGNLTVNGNTTVVGNLASGTLNLTNQGVAPGAAGAGTVNLYTKTADKRLYYKDDSGTEIGPIATASGAQTNVSNTFTAAQNIDADFRNKGPNPWADIVRFGGYSSVAPIPKTTGSITSGTATLTLASAIDFANGHGITILGAGPGSVLATPTGLTVAPANAVGTTAYNYCIVAEDYAGGRTACSASSATTTGVATLGIQSATISSCSRVSGVVTCTTTAAHNFISGSQVDIQNGSTTDRTFEAATTITSVPTSTTFTYNEYSYPDATISSGTVRVNGTNKLKWNTDSTFRIIRSYIYRCTASCGVVGPNYVLAGVAIGWDGYFQDYGYAMTAANIGNGDVPATAPTTASNTWLSTTILSGGGTTALTLANNAGATVAGATVLHDNTPNIIAACNSFNSKAGIVYIPNPNALYNTYPITSTLELARCPLQTQLQLAGEPNLSATIKYGSGASIKGLPSANVYAQTPAFYGIRPTALIGGTAYPFFLLSSITGNNVSMDDILQQCNQPYQVCTYHDQTLTGDNPVAVRYTNVHFNGSTQNTAMVLKGGFGFFFEYGGWSNTPANFSAPPALLVTPNCGYGNSGQQMAYYVTSNYTYAFGGILMDTCGVFGAPIAGWEFRNMLGENAYVPMFRANTAGNYLVNFGFYVINDADARTGYATPLIDIAGSTVQQMRVFAPGCGNGTQPIFTVGSPTSALALEVVSNSCNYIGAPTAIIRSGQVNPGGDLYSNTSLGTNGALGHVYYQMAVPAAPQSAVVSAGGSVPIGAHVYTVSAFDWSGNETPVGPGISATATSGNQTVTITLPAAFPAGAKGVNLRRDTYPVTAGGCAYPQYLTPGTVVVETTSFTCGASPSSTNQAGISLLDVNGLTTTQLRLSSELLTASPRSEQNVFLPGALTSAWTGSSWTLDRAMTVTRVQAQAKTTPAGCTTNAIVRLTDGTTPVNVTVAAVANDSGAIAQNYAAGAALTISVQTAAAGCTTSPADVNVTIQYRMQ